MEKTNSRCDIWNYFGLKSSTKMDTFRKIYKTNLFAEHVDEVFRRRMGIPTTCLHICTTIIPVCTYVEASSESKESKSKLLEQEKDPTQFTLAQSFNCSRKYLPNLLQAQEINKTVCHFLATGMYSISTVDEAGFRSLMYKLNPRYNCPSRKHFSEKELPQLYANVRDTKIKP